ncbi:MAG: hypothetical protein OHK0015_24540 [Chloroflexi bacterium OHK40]
MDSPPGAALVVASDGMASDMVAAPFSPVRAVVCQADSDEYRFQTYRLISVAVTGSLLRSGVCGHFIVAGAARGLHQSEDPDGVRNGADMGETLERPPGEQPRSGRPVACPGGLSAQSSHVHNW